MFVCAANVCRSPLMAFVLAQQVRDAQRDEEWTITSAGTDVSHAAALCAVDVELIADDPAGEAFAATHTASALEPDMLDEYDVILTASRSERSAVARLRPDLRARTFTLKEAVALGSDRMLGDQGGDVSSEQGRSLASYAAMLDGRRGRVTWPAVHPLRARWFHTPDPRDIPDVHHESSKLHVATLDDVRASVTALYANIEAYLQSEPRPS